METGREGNQFVSVSFNSEYLNQNPIFKYLSLFPTGVDCGPLDDIPNGRVIIRPNTRFQSTASYSCNQGFQLVGQQQRQCQADGNWSGREPVCVRK